MINNTHDRRLNKVLQKTIITLDNTDIVLDLVEALHHFQSEIDVFKIKMFDIRCQVKSSINFNVQNKVAVKKSVRDVTYI